MQNNLTSSRKKSAWLFLAPSLFILAIIAGWPLLRTIFFSMTDANLAFPDEREFIFLENYSYLFADNLWWKAVFNTLKFTIISVSLELIIGMLVALVLNSAIKGRGMLRAAIMIPWAIPTIVSAQMWGWMMHDFYGVLNEILVFIGVISQPLAWTADPDLALYSVIIADVWKTTPFMALLCLAALQMIPQDCYESAKIDGVNPVKVFFKVTLPMIKPALMVAVIFRALDAMRVFDLIYVLTSNSSDTMSMSIYARQQLVDFQDIGYGSAASTTLFMVIMIATALIMMAGKVKLTGKD